MEIKTEYYLPHLIKIGETNSFNKKMSDDLEIKLHMKRYEVELNCEHGTKQQFSLQENDFLPLWLIPIHIVPVKVSCWDISNEW